jgi:hypothetical protein
VCEATAVVFSSQQRNEGLRHVCAARPVQKPNDPDRRYL